MAVEVAFRVAEAGTEVIEKGQKEEEGTEIELKGANLTI